MEYGSFVIIIVYPSFIARSNMLALMLVTSVGGSIYVNTTDCFRLP